MSHSLLTDNTVGSISIKLALSVWQQSATELFAATFVLVPYRSECDNAHRAQTTSFFPAPRESVS